MTQNNERSYKSGNAEFKKAFKRIKTLREAGHSIKAVHDKLVKAGRITMSYATFYYHLKKSADLMVAAPAAPVGQGRPPKRRKA